MMSEWRFLDSGFASGEENMRLDHDLFEQFCADPNQSPILRIYGFSEPCLTYGYSQVLTELRHVLPMPRVPRITGGGIVFHGKDLTYSVTGSRDHHPEFKSVRSSYRILHEVIRRAFLKREVELRFYAGAEAHGLDAYCFEGPRVDDLCLRSRKIAGAAQKRSHGVFLHQGSVELEPLTRSDDKFEETYVELKQAIVASFCEVFNIEAMLPVVAAEVLTQPIVG